MFNQLTIIMFIGLAVMSITPLLVNATTDYTNMLNQLLTTEYVGCSMVSALAWVDAPNAFSCQARLQKNNDDICNTLPDLAIHIPICVNKTIDTFMINRTINTVNYH